MRIIDRRRLPPVLGRGRGRKEAAEGIKGLLPLLLLLLLLLPLLLWPLLLLPLLLLPLLLHPGGWAAGGVRLAKWRPELGLRRRQQRERENARDGERCCAGANCPPRLGCRVLPPGHQPHHTAGRDLNCARYRATRPRNNPTKMST